MIDQNALTEALEMLYRARWNVPRAASHCGLPHHEMKRIFAEEVRSGKLPPQKWGVPNHTQLELGL